jgi:hypothetical protein
MKNRIINVQGVMGANSPEFEGIKTSTSQHIYES